MDLQLGMQREYRCRLAMPSFHVPRAHISGHWDPAALARWNAVIPTCRLVCRAGRPCAEITMEFGTRADAPAGKKVRVSSLE